MDPDPIDELESELVDMWRRGGVSARARATAVDPKLDAACYPLLMLLTRRADAVPMATLIEVLGVGKSTLSRQVDAVTRLGLARRISDPSDARARLVELTPEGRVRLVAHRDEHIAVWRRKLARWDPDDLRALSALLRRLGDEVG
ncbi:MarR family winged helix-turn-helix transcriptional regulator [Rhodococcus sp. NPDC058505]|uniref:MarR family winged helix-turn-helix transcriptional regulator n=1 Tax=unclassified Rhodococcus (in: high G+C Gram-positive bacteria) TaxID=192944 RepID=UPI003659EEFD